jgi:periplasmic protein TonB
MTLPGSARPDSDTAFPGNQCLFATVTLDSRTRTSPWAIGTSTVVNGAFIAVLLILGLRATGPHFSPPLIATHPISLTDFPLFAPHPNNSGTGSGSHDLIDPTRGNPPRQSAMPLAPPIVPTIVDPKLAVEPSITVSLPSDPSLPNIGMQHSPNITMASNGPGGPAGIGSGGNGPYGNGTGKGPFGPGTGDGLLPGNGVKAPILVYAPLAEFSDEARRNKYQGVCMIAVVVDAEGNTRNPQVVQALGEGLDEKALDAVRRYKFKPGMKDGHAVPTRITVEVNFRLF